MGHGPHPNPPGSATGRHVLHIHSTHQGFRDNVILKCVVTSPYTITFKTINIHTFKTRHLQPYGVAKMFGLSKDKELLTVCT